MSIATRAIVLSLLLPWLVNAARIADVPEAAVLRPPAGAAAAAVLPQRLDDVADRVIQLINAERRAQGLAEVAVQPTLQAVAREHVAELAATQQPLVAVDVDRELIRERIEAAGVEQAGIGENLARNNFPLPETAQRTVQDLLGKPGERAVLVAPDHRWIGVGVANAADVRYFVIILVTPPEP